MRPRTAIAAVLGLVGAARLLRRRREKPAPDPAEDLRAKLAEARAAAQDRDEFEAGETTVDQAEPSVDDRRRAVHEAGRDAIQRMRDGA